MANAQRLSPAGVRQCELCCELLDLRKYAMCGHVNASHRDAVVNMQVKTIHVVRLGLGTQVAVQAQRNIECARLRVRALELYGRQKTSRKSTRTAKGNTNKPNVR